MLTKAISNLLKSPSFIKYFKNTFWLFSEKAITFPINLFLGAYVVRFLGPENFGILSYSQSFVAIMSALATLGMDQIIVRDLVLAPQKKDLILGTAFILKLIGAALLLVFSFASSYVVANEPFVLILVLVISSSYFFQAFSVIDFQFQATVNSKRAVFSRVISVVFVAAIKIFLVLSNADIVWFAIAIVFENLFVALGYIFYSKSIHLEIFKWKFSKILSLQILKNSWPIILTGLFISTQAYIDQIILGRLVNKTEVGQYSAAIGLISFFAFIPMVLQSSLAPAITRAKQKSDESYYDYLLNLYRLMFIIFLLILIPVILFGNKMVVLYYGDAFKEAGILFTFLGFRLFLANFGVAKSLFIINNNLFKYSLFTAFIGTIVSIVFNFLLVPKYHALGSIFASFIAFTFTTFIIDLFFESTRKNVFIMFKSIATFYKIKLKY
jgi:O-antigen/teichoic acid export membrane protein